MQVKMLTGGATIAGRERKRGDVFECDDALARKYIVSGDLEPVAAEVRTATVKPERNTLKLPRRREA